MTNDSEMVHEPVTLMNAQSKSSLYPGNRSKVDVAATKDTEYTYQV